MKKTEIAIRKNLISEVCKKNPTFSYRQLALELIDTYPQYFSNLSSTKIVILNFKKNNNIPQQTKIKNQHNQGTIGQEIIQNTNNSNIKSKESEKTENSKKSGDSFSQKSNNNETEMNYSQKTFGNNSQEIDGNFTSLEELIEKSNIDTTIWECYDFQIIEGQWDVASKNRDQDLTWKIVNDSKGNPIQLMEGHATRKNDFVIQKNKKYHIRAKFRLKPGIYNKDNFKSELLEDIKNLTKIENSKIEILKINLNSNKTHFALEINRFDLHYGKMIWGEETAGGYNSESQENNYDVKKAQELYNEAGKYLLNEAQKICKIDKIIIPVGNDFFNSDNSIPFPITTKGTPQQEDMRWQKLFRQGRILLAHDLMIMKKLNPNAVIGVPVIPGNHDFQKSFYLGDALECMFLNDPQVVIDNSPNPHKYWHYGNTLIGFTHEAKSLNRLGTTMQEEIPEMWFKSKYREWHLGHIHHSKKVELLTEEDRQSITFRWMRTLMPYDAWENTENYKSQKGAEAFIWSKDKGLYHMIPFNI